MSQSRSSDPATGLRFHVSVDHADIGSFTACEGLGAEYEILEYAEGGENSYVHRLPGRLKYSTVKLTRPVDADSGAIAAWFAGLKTAPARKTVAITALDPAGCEIACWQLDGAYPTKWSGPSFSIDGQSVAKETLELAHNGFIR
jgi:phage tail-like protein